MTSSARAFRRVEHAIADRERPSVGDDLVVPQLAGRPQALPRALVEVGDIATAVGDHDRPLAGRVRAEPVVDQAIAHCRCRRRSHDPAVLLVLAHEQIEIAVAERRKRLAIPRLVLTPDLAQLQRPELVRERSE